MSLDPLHQKQIASANHGALWQVQTILICKNSLVRAGIRHILRGTHFMVAEEGENSPTLTASPDAAPALYILDDNHGADALVKTVTDLKAQSPAARVVVLSNHLDRETMMRAMEAGMNGLCLVTMDRDALLRVLELVMLGEDFIPSATVLAMLDELPQAHESGPTPANMPSTLGFSHDTATGANNLSGRETEILAHLMEGNSNKVIAKKLDIAEATIKVHIKAILRKIRVKNRTQAAMWAAAHLKPH